MNMYAIIRRHGWQTPEELGEAAGRSRQVGDEEMPERVRWIRTYALGEADGAIGTVCIYEATDPQALREHAARAALPCDEIVPIADTLVVRPDPAPATA